jgi:hypothetical protein
MTLTGPDRDEVFQWDPSEPELMKAMILAGVQIQMPINHKPHNAIQRCDLK